MAVPVFLRQFNFYQFGGTKCPLLARLQSYVHKSVCVRVRACVRTHIIHKHINI